MHSRKTSSLLLVSCRDHTMLGSDAFARVVERLLASPTYGERWGRHWLDVARYADSNGMDENVTYGHAWRYRDYVVRAFNDNKPFDRFLIEQVAGDSVQLSQGSVYPALIRLEQEGWIETAWGLSETNRKVKFYSLTKAGRKQLVVEVASWEKATALVARFLEPAS